ncbi:ABC-2 type transport system permease protein [Anaerobranca californiensis DSM 14826]|uniref:ABC-2 type transport system permease protein n=1 Tax=Anaerobranca californiensis DSM 14826 TaxID=1120989 RepID=A0A1M6MUV2_9FIRM|nr:hypothetical protein [Anaerobranca californiensis]SHJ87285.1 ABC-2 type transport system permease protein [Anaerobranca californiensis DSM 14826]
MNKTLLLTKVLLKNSLSAMFGMGKNKRYSFIMLAIVLVSLAPLYIGLTRFLYVSFDYLAQIGQQGVIISLGIVVTGMLIFFLGIFYIISLFYMAEDIENLLSLPLKTSHILGANFFSVVIYEYITSLFFLLPVLVVYGIKGSSSGLYYLYSIIVFLTLPIIPLSLASIISMVIMRFLNKGKNKDLLKLVGSLLAMVVVLSINFVFQRVSMRFTDMESIINLLIEGNNSLVNLTNKMFPGLSFAASALIRSDNFIGFVHLMAYLAISIVVFVVFLMLGEILYLKGVQGSWESISKKTELTEEQLSKSTRKNSPLKSYISKELKILFRTPAFLLNCVIINFLWPVFIAFPLLASGEGLKEISKLGKIIVENNLQSLTIVIGLGVGIFISATNSIVSTSISREGQNFYINKYIPMSYKRQILGKIIPGIILSTLGLLMILIIVAVVIKLPPILSFLILLSAMVGILFNSMIGLIFDLFSPKLIWDNEQKAVKQNLNPLFHIILSTVVIGVNVFLVVKLDFSSFVVTGSLFVIYLGLSYILYKFLITKGVEVYSNIGE